MAIQTKGFCKYCGKEYTKGGMLRHLQGCKKRSERLAEEKGKRRCRYFQIVITGKYIKDYWLIIETSENTLLKELDQFIRDIWVECCGHLSAFTIRGEQYESTPAEDSFWGRPSRNMNYRLKDVVDAGDSFLYEYDFGSTTELILSVHSCREGEKKNNEIVILSRNNPPELMCSKCECRKAKWISPVGYYGEEPFWCEECLKENNREEGEYEDEYEDEFEPDCLLPVCNSPRMGVCGYEGSNIYPDQFEPDRQ